MYRFSTTLLFACIGLCLGFGFLTKIFIYLEWETAWNTCLFMSFFSGFFVACVFCMVFVYFFLWKYRFGKMITVLIGLLFLGYFPAECIMNEVSVATIYDLNTVPYVVGLATMEYIATGVYCWIMRKRIQNDVFDRQR